jgi:hypothetical protein
VGRSAVHVPSITRGRDDGPLTFRDEALTGQILIDDKSFERCKFDKAVLVYTGGAPPQIVDCSFRDVVFEFQGAAGRALAFLQALSAPSSGLRDVFKASFPRLFGH